MSGSQSPLSSREKISPLDQPIFGMIYSESLESLNRAGVSEEPVKRSELNRNTSQSQGQLQNIKKSGSKATVEPNMSGSQSSLSSREKISPLDQPILGMIYSESLESLNKAATTEESAKESLQSFPENKSFIVIFFTENLPY